MKIKTSKTNLKVAKPSISTNAKWCPRCQKIKLREEFAIDKKKLNGLHIMCKECDRKAMRIRNHLLKMTVLAHYSNSRFAFCASCGENNINTLELDHYYGGGTKHRESLKCYYSTDFYRYLKDHNYPNDPRLQVLCQGCNLAKETWNKERKGRGKSKNKSNNNQNLLLAS